MFPSKLPLLLLGFLAAGTVLTYVQAKPIDEYDYPINSIENEISDEEIFPHKNGFVDDEEVEEGEAEERNVLNELDAEVEEDAAEEESNEEEVEEEIAEDEKKDEDDEEAFDEEIADAEEEVGEGEEDAVEEEKAIAEEEEAAEDEDHAIAEEEEKVADEEENEVDEDIPKEEKKSFPYSWYDKVKKFFKGRK